MSAGDIQVAVATVTLATRVNALDANPALYMFPTPVVTVLYTFFRVPSNPNILHLTASQQPGIIDIRPALPIQPPGWNITSWVTWNPAEPKQQQIRWGTIYGDVNQAVVPFTDGGLTVQPSPTSVLTPALESSLASITGSTGQDAKPNTGPPATTPKPTSSPLTPKPMGSGNDGITGGAAAGIAIGCLVAGVLIAGIAFWLCWARRRTSRTPDYEASKTELMSREKGFATNAISLGSGSPAASPITGTLPLPLEDKAITGDISKISNSIKNHVQSYYHTGRVSPGLIDYDDIQALGISLPISVGTLSTLLGNSATREITLRLCIAWVVISRMQPTHGPGESLLPSEVAQFSRKIENVNGDARTLASMLARWRAMTAELMQSAYVRNAFTSSDSRNASVQAAVSVLDTILQPYADSRMDNEQRKRNLEEILKRAAVFAFTLFSQPSTWDFDWKEEQGVKSGELCIFPALVQFTDENGEPVIPPRPFSEAVVRRLDE